VNSKIGLLIVLIIATVTLSETNVFGEMVPRNSSGEMSSPKGFITDLGWFPVSGPIQVETNSGLKYITVSFDHDLADGKMLRKAYISDRNVQADNWAHSNPETGNMEAHVFYDIPPGESNGAFVVEWPR
jgi:hypothetical protein